MIPDNRKPCTPPTMRCRVWGLALAVILAWAAVLLGPVVGATAAAEREDSEQPAAESKEPPASAPSGGLPKVEPPSGDPPARSGPGDKPPAAPAANAAARPRIGMVNPMGQVKLIDKAVKSLSLEGELKEKVAAIEKEYQNKFAEAMAIMRKDAPSREEKVTACEKVNALVEDYLRAVNAALPEAAQKRLQEALPAPVPTALLLAVVVENSGGLNVTKEQSAALEALRKQYPVAATDAPDFREKLAAIKKSDVGDEEKAKARQALMNEARNKDREGTAKVAKILDAEQMMLALDLARQRMAPAGEPGGGAPDALPRRNVPDQEKPVAMVWHTEERDRGDVSRWHQESPAEVPGTGQLANVG